MNKKELLKEFIEQLTDECVRLQPYFEILGDSLDVYNLLYEKDKIICSALGLNEAEHDIVSDFAYWKATGSSFSAVRDWNGKLIETPDELVDILLSEGDTENE